MSKLNTLLKKAEHVLSDNSPAILTGLGVVGLVSTAVLSGKATVKACEIIDHEERIGGTADRRGTRVKERVKLVWKLYIPTFGVGALSIAAIIGSHRIGTRRAAAVAAAYSLSEKAFTEYREKIVEKIGENKEREAREEIAQERVNKTAPPTMIVTGDATQVLCHDAYSNQYFMSDMETLRKAQNDINAQILHADYATVSDLYSYIDAEGLEPTSISGEMGWNTDKMLEMDYTTVLYKDKTPCISIHFATIPVRDPWRFC